MIMEVSIKTFFFLGITVEDEYTYIGLDKIMEHAENIDLTQVLKHNAGKIEIRCDGQTFQVNLENLEYLFRGLLNNAEHIIQNKPFVLTLLLSELETLYGFPINNDVFVLEKTLDNEDYTSLDKGRYRSEEEHLMQRIFLYKSDFIAQLCSEAEIFISKMRLIKEPNFADWWGKDIKKIRNIVAK